MKGRMLPTQRQHCLKMMKILSLRCDKKSQSYLFSPEPVKSWNPESTAWFKVLSKRFWENPEVLFRCHAGNLPESSSHAFMSLSWNWNQPWSMSANPNTSTDQASEECVHICFRDVSNLFPFCFRFRFNSETFWGRKQGQTDPKQWYYPYFE